MVKYLNNLLGTTQRVSGNVAYEPPRVLMEVVPAVFQLHLAGFAHESEVHHGSDPFALHHLGVTALFVHRP